MDQARKNSLTTSGGIVFDLKKRDGKIFSLLVSPNHEISKNIKDYFPVLRSAGANFSDFFAIIRNCKYPHRFMESLDKNSYRTNGGVMFDLKNIDAISVNLLKEFGDRIANEAKPIDDHRSTAVYRRHAVSTLARRLLTRANTK